MERKLHDHGHSLKKEGPSLVTDTIFLRSTEAPSLVAAATRVSGEASSSGEAFSVIPATDRTPGHLPQGGGAPGQPAGEREPEAPTIDELISQIKLVLRGHRKLRSDVLKKIQEDIRLEQLPLRNGLMSISITFQTTEIPC